MEVANIPEPFFVVVSGRLPPPLLGPDTVSPESWTRFLVWLLGVGGSIGTCAMAFLPAMARQEGRDASNLRRRDWLDLVGWRINAEIGVR